MSLGHDKINFLHLPTPLEKLENISKDLGIELYIKRDDLTPLATGGNKLRKLEYFLKDAMDQGATMLITEGGAQTNHGRLTAAVATKFGMKCAIITEDEYPGEMSANLLLDGILGCPVYFVSNMETGRQAVIDKYASEGEKVYYVPMGGSNELGILGYYDCASELTVQAKEMGLEDAQVYVTVGSMGTYLGMKLSFELENSPLGLTGVNVLPYDGDGDEKANLLDALEDYYGKIKSFYNLDLNLTKENFDITTDYIYGAYNNCVEEVREALYYIARKEAIIIDPCYTGKTFDAILGRVKSGEIKPGSKVIFIHTGGYPGIYTKHHRLAMENELMGYMHRGEY
ncbi:MAG: pyridoxal-phosphate dependent enzyme [Clostridiales bacterium]|jgi:1-aminocyclopropane-1-carboxylate deaminase/D-cysteine desulfhydrase-like pyridoxal-dependent ACC family enzyme|nr:pyridoxal-phosphate dependent enzyme [Clostridiales bacterium]